MFPDTVFFTRFCSAKDKHVIKEK